MRQKARTSKMPLGDADPQKDGKADGPFLAAVDVPAASKRSFMTSESGRIATTRM
jgi:hypothetical protein